MLKRFSTLWLTLLFLGFGGFILADNEASVEQVSPGEDTCQIFQEGEGNLITGAGLVNGNPAAYQEAGSGNNSLTVEQNNGSNTLDLNQVAGNYNWANIIQGGNNSAIIDQAAGTYNQLEVQQLGSNSSVILSEISLTGHNSDTIIQEDDNETVWLFRQTWGGDNDASIKQDGGDNLVVGTRVFNSRPEVDPDVPAEQNSFFGGSNNYLEVVQEGGANEIGLWQTAQKGSNDAFFYQYDGGNIAAVYQYCKGNGDNFVEIVQEGGNQIVKVYQKTESGDNFATVVQGP